jgi:hypothetical protein
VSLDKVIDKVIKFLDRVVFTPIRLPLISGIIIELKVWQALL